MPYAHTTFLEARNRLAQDLGDSDKVFFQDAELGRYIVEALRWWGLSSMYFRETGKVETVAGQAFYDITAVLKNLPETFLLQGYTITDRELINDINYAVMENQITNWALGWAGTEMFSLEEITGNLQDCRDEFLKLTGSILAETPVFIGVADNRVNLGEPFIRAMRASIREDGAQGPLPLWPVDQVQLQTTTRSAFAGPSTSRPKAFSVSYSPQLTIDLWPAPSQPSTLTLHVIRAGLPFTPTASSTLVGVPEDASFILKYMTLGSLFGGDGLSRAPMMADYCVKRVQDGLDTLARYQSLLWADMGGRKGPLTSVAQRDQLRPTWQQVTGKPVTTAQLNWNLFALSPVPDAIYALTYEVVRKAHIPVNDGDFIQVGPECMQAIYDYAYHIALIKSQGAEFQASIAKYQAAMETAQEYRSQVASQSYLYRESQLPPIQDRWSRPLRRQAPVEAAQQDRELIEV